MRTYSKDGSDQFNEYLDSVLTSLSEEIAQAVGYPFVALILAGGYGRGEGPASSGTAGNIPITISISSWWSLKRTPSVRKC